MGWYDNFHVRKKSKNTETSWEFGKDYRIGGAPPTMIFLGLAKKVEDFEMMYPKVGDSLIIYETPSALVSSDPVEARDAYEQVIAEAQCDIWSHHVGRILGISLGSTIATYLANNNGLDLTLGMPPDRAGSVTWNSPRISGLMDEAKERGFSEEDYKVLLGKWDPVENLDNLADNDVRVFLAKGDTIVPYQNGLNLVKAMQDKGIDPLVRKVPILGHYLGGGYLILANPGNFLGSN